MAHIEHINEFHQAADRLVTVASKDELADTIRLMALNLAHYAAKFGTLPQEEIQAIGASDEPTQEQLQLVVNGLEIMVGMLGNVVQGMNNLKAN